MSIPNTSDKSVDLDRQENITKGTVSAKKVALYTYNAGGDTLDPLTGAGDGSIIDGVSSSIKATVKDYTNSNPLTVVTVDTNGDPVSAGAGTQYTEDAAAAADPVGTAVNLVRKDTPATITSTDGDNVAQRGTNYGAGYVQVVTSAGAFVDTFGGGTQFADGAARGTATGTIAMVDDGTNIQSLSGDSTGKLNVNNISGTVSLPTGAATSALQTQPGVDIGDVTINNAAGASAVNIQDGGNSITVDGTVTASNVSGDVAAGAADSGNPVKVGGKYNATRPTLADGNRGDLQLGTRGSLGVTLFSADSLSSITTGGDSTDAQAAAAANRFVVIGRTSLYNGTTWDMAREVANATNSTGVGIAAAGILAQFDDTSPTAITENQFGNLRMSANRNAYQTIRDAAGNERGLNISAGGNISVDTVSTVTSVTQNADVRQATASNLNAQVVGAVAHDGVDSGNPIKVGGKARTTNPTAVADADRVDATFDDVGRQVVVLNQVRDLEVHQTTTIAASTAETTILTAGAAGVFHDITLLTVCNTSATATRVDLRDATAGSVIWSLYIPAGQTVGANITTPVKQTTAANNWTLTCITSLTDLRIFVQAVKNV